MSALKGIVLFAACLTCLALACGGRATRTSKSERDASGGDSGEATGGRSGSRGTASGGMPAAPTGGSRFDAGLDAALDASDGGSAGSDEQPRCDDFLALWQARQAEREPGEPIPPIGSDAPCFDCVELGASACGSLAALGCSPAEACLERNCLCTPEEPVQQSCGATDYPSDLCACAEGCIPSGDPCGSVWRNYTECIVERCSQACEL